MGDTGTLILPDDFPDIASEVEAKGVYWMGQVELRGRQYPITFYDPVRLGQDVSAELALGGCFCERNVVVVPSVTRAHMEAAVTQLSRTGIVGRLVAP